MDNTVYYTTAILLISVIVFVLLERKFPYRKGLTVFREGFWVDIIWYTLIQSYFLKIFIFDYIIFPLDKQYHFSDGHWLTNWPIGYQVLFFLITHDFYIYWFHRWQHHNKVLWRTHEAHHSNKEVDWLAGTRSHSIEILINQTIEFAPIVLLGAAPMVIPIKALLDAVWGMYIHANINVKSGKLQYIINGPEMHLWHHANDRKVFYANFSTKFAIWDWLFGTAYLPQHQPDEYGLYYDYPKDYFAQHVFMVHRFNEQALLKNKWLQKYYNIRPLVYSWLMQLFSKNKKETTQSTET